MKTASAIIASIGLFCFAVFAQVGTISRQVLVNTNGVVVSPTNLWVANSNGIVAVTGTGGGGGGSGTVTSIGASSSVSGIGFSGSPVTTSGTLSLTGTVAVASGGTGATNASGARTALSLVPGTDVQAYDTDLAAIAALANAGIVVRTGSGTVAARTITGDSEISVTNGDGVSGNPTLAIGAAIARLTSPAFDGTPTVPTASSGTSNTVAASTAYVDRAVASGGGGGGGISSTPRTNTWSGFTLITDASLSTRWRVLLTNGSTATLNVPTNGTDGQDIRWEFQQDSTGSRLLSLGTGFGVGTDITGVTLSTNAHAVDYVAATFNSVSNVWRVISVIRGY